MKKAIHLFLLIPVLLHSGGMMLICMLLQTSIQYKVDEILKNPNTQFEKLILSSDQYLKDRFDEREISVDGRVYDIKEVVFHKDYVELVAFNDTEEAGLISVIENFFSSSEDSKKEFPAQVLKLLVSVYTIPENSFDLCRDLSTDIFQLSVSQLYHSFSNDTFSPPPEITS